MLNYDDIYRIAMFGHRDFYGHRQLEERLIPISDLEAKYNADDYYFEQELMDLFRPSVEHNQAWEAMLFLELRFYSCMPESYTKSVRNMVLAEEEA